MDTIITAAAAATLTDDEMYALSPEELTARNTCAICLGPLVAGIALVFAGLGGFQWTDTHGIAKHARCGEVYRLYHYEPNPEYDPDKDTNHIHPSGNHNSEERRVDKPPTLLVKPEWLPIVRRFWLETHSEIDPGACSFLSRSAPSAAAVKTWADWLDAHKDELPEAPS